ncbi:alpha/beta hydrolase family protein [Vagococcus fluvialis]|uniref:alpha/beta hydrolase family protein n=1 Tax=Vagococcus fluvialis TaxID=2738 RepID=UPI001D0B83D7|nr:alpha/beta fold hydrolase [Vagococcus fluvialis]UDM79872.1 alpha/beta hydrolase [Vagococcus fluvialis]
MKKVYLGLVLLSGLVLGTACSPSIVSQEETTKATEVAVEKKESIQLVEEKVVSERKTEIPASIVLPVDTSKEVPLVVLAHGFMGSRDEAGGFTEVSEKLAENGIASIRIDFPGCNESTEPTTAYSMKNNTDDVMSAINYMKENYKINSDKIGMLGYSMGGRITSLVSKEIELDTIVLWAPLISKTWEGTLEGELLNNKLTEATKSGESTIEFFGNDISISLDLLQDLNNDQSLLNISEYKGNALLITGGKDNVVLPSVTDNVADKLGQVANFETITLDNVGHGMGIYEEDRESQNKLVESSSDFFVNYLK